MFGRTKQNDAEAELKAKAAEDKAAAENKTGPTEPINDGDGSGADNTESEKAPESATAPKAKKKKRTCTRCKGDGHWHSTKSGVRAKRSAEPLVDRNRSCPECG